MPARSWRSTEDLFHCRGAFPATRLGSMRQRSTHGSCLAAALRVATPEPSGGAIALASQARLAVSGAARKGSAGFRVSCDAAASILSPSASTAFRTADPVRCAYFAVVDAF